MTDTIAVAVMSLAGTLGGSLFGVIASQRMTDFRLRRLEEKQDRHNMLIERTYSLEGRVGGIEKEIKELKGRIG